MAPWSVRIGGRFTPAMTWSGVGEFHAGNGERFGLYVDLYPYFRGRMASPFRTRLPRYNLRGTASLCTLQGSIYNYKMSGGIYGVYTSTDGGDVSLYITDPKRQLKRSLEFYGTWHGPELMMEDNGSFDRSFRTDGALKPRLGPWPVPGHEQRAGGTLTWGSYATFENMCRNQIMRQ